MVDQPRGRCRMLIGLLFLFALQAGGAQKSKAFFGVYGGGSSFSQDMRFGSKHYSFSFDLNFHLGGYLQYNLSERFGLQLNLNYQDMVSQRSFFEGTAGPYRYDYPPERTGLRSFNLHLVVNWLKLKMAQFYLLAGPGITSGKWHVFTDSYFNINATTGVIIYLTAKSRPAVNLGWTWRRLLDPGENGTVHSNYQSFLIGLEF